MVAPKKEIEKGKIEQSNGGPVLVFEVKELLVNFQGKAGAYNKESYYGHIMVAPKETMIVKVPVSKIESLDTVQEAIGELSIAVIKGIRLNMEIGKPVGEVESVSNVGGRPALLSVGREDVEEF